ncbi:MAG: ATP-binding cassette domain-containing protein [Chloroflexota bacterium]
MSQAINQQDSKPVITINNLRKVYHVPVREAGVGAAFRGLFNRKNREVVAVDDISFNVAPGEIVGFLGPNGAGKTTTLKMLSGLLHPTNGDASVLGYQPWRRPNELLKQITLVMGNRNQLVWDIPCIDSFELQRAIYRIPHPIYEETIDELIELLDLSELLQKPVRNLSLGERMKCEIAGALIHRPKVLFLDEPTIGLDVTMQRRIRQFISEYNRIHNATVMLTSHYMADVKALCKRVVMIHQGEILFDGPLTELVTRFSPHKTISLQLAETALVSLNGAASPESLARFGDVVEQAQGTIKLRVPKSDTAQITSQLLAELPIDDLTVEEPPIEDVIEQAFAAKE